MVIAKERCFIFACPIFLKRHSIIALIELLYLRQQTDV